MSDYILIFALTIVMAFSILVLGIAIASHNAEKDSVEEYFLRRDAYRQKEKALKKELEETKRARDDYRKQMIIFRDEVQDLSLELGEVKCQLRAEKERKK